MKIDLHKHAMVAWIQGPPSKVRKAANYVFRRVILETQATVTWRMFSFSVKKPPTNMQVLFDDNSSKRPCGVSPRDARRIAEICKDAERCF